MPKRRKQNPQSSSSLYFDVMQEKIQAENIKRKKLSMKANSEPELLFLQFDPNITGSRASSSVNKCLKGSGSTSKKTWQPPIKVNNQGENTEFNKAYIKKGKLSNESPFLQEIKENVPHYKYKKHILNMSSVTNFENTTFKDSNHFDSEKNTTNTNVNDEQDFIQERKNKEQFDNGNLNVEMCRKMPISVQDDGNKKWDVTKDKCILNHTNQMIKNPNINETSIVNQDSLKLFNDDECDKIKQVEDIGNVINEHNLKSCSTPLLNSQTEANCTIDHEERNTNVKGDLDPDCNQVQYLYSGIQQKIILKSGDSNEIDEIITFNNNIVSGNLNEEVDKILCTPENKGYVHKKLHQEIKITALELNRDCEENYSTNYHEGQESKSIIREQKDEDIQIKKMVDCNTIVKEIHFSEMKTFCEHDVRVKSLNTINNNSYLNEFEGKKIESTLQDKKEEGYECINVQNGKQCKATLADTNEKLEENKFKDDEEKELISTVKKQIEMIDEDQSENEEKEYKLSIQDQNENFMENKCIDNWEEKELVSTVQEQKGKDEGNESIGVHEEKESILTLVDQYGKFKENIYLNDYEEKEIIYTAQEQHDKIEENINNYDENLCKTTNTLDQYEQCEEIESIKECREKEFIYHEQEQNYTDKINESICYKEEYEYKPSTLDQYEKGEEIECIGNYEAKGFTSTIEVRNEEKGSYDDFVMVDSLFENSDSSEEEGEVLSELLNKENPCLSETDKCSEHSCCKTISYSLEPRELCKEIITSTHSNTCDIYDKDVDDKVNDEGLRHSQASLTSQMWVSENARIKENVSYLTPCSTIVNKNSDKLEETVEENNLQEHQDYDESVEEENSCMMISNSQLCEIEKMYYDNNQENSPLHVQTLEVDQERDLKNESILETNKTICIGTQNDLIFDQSVSFNKTISIGTQTDLIFDQSVSFNKIISIGTQTDVILDQPVSFNQGNAFLHQQTAHNHKRIREMQIRIQSAIQEIDRLNAILFQLRQESWPRRDFSDSALGFSNTSFTRKK